jgi:stage III sporulation protein AD
MERFWQAAAGALVAIVLWLILSRQGRDYALLLSLLVCCMILTVMGRYLEPVLDLVKRLQMLGNLQPEWISVMLKAVGIGLVVELASLICSDAGNASVGKAIQFLGTSVILWLSIPLINGLLDLITQVLGDV